MTSLISPKISLPVNIQLKCTHLCHIQVDSFIILCLLYLKVGPAGSQFGILSTLLVEVIQSWQLIASPVQSLAKVGGFTVVLFVLGKLYHSLNISLYNPLIALLSIADT